MTELPQRPDQALPPTDGAERIPGLDGIAVEKLLGGAVLKGHDPLDVLRKAAIDPSVYGNAQESIDGRALFRLISEVVARPASP